MLTLYKKIIVVAIAAISITVYSCTDLDEKWYSEVTPDTFFSSKESVNSVLVRSFTHWRWYQTLDRYRLQELTTDELATTQKGPHFESGGVYKRLHYHTWTPDESSIFETWRGTGMGIALAMESKEDLEKVDYIKLGYTEEIKTRSFNAITNFNCILLLKRTGLFWRHAYLSSYR